MAKTNAERAAAFRSRRAVEKRKQINAWVSEEAYVELKQMAESHGLSFGDMLDGLLTKALLEDVMKARVIRKYAPELEKEILEGRMSTDAAHQIAVQKK